MIVLAACSNGSSDGPPLTFADFTTPSSPSVVDEAEATTTTTGVPDAASSTTTTTTIAVAPPEPGMLIADDGGVWAADGSDSRLFGQAVQAFFDDLQGGFVLQLPGAGFDPGADQRVFWSRASDRDARPYLDVADGALLRLWGVATIAGAPHMIITTSAAPDAPRPGLQELIVHDFNSARVLAELSGTGAGPTAVSYGGSQFVLERQQGAMRFFEFRNENGALLDLAYNPLSECIDDSTCPRLPVLAPAGGMLAYVQSDFGDDGTLGTYLVLYDLEQGAEADRYLLPGNAVTALEYDGATVIVNRSMSQPPWLVDTATGAVAELDAPGYATYQHSEPGFEGQFELAG